MSQTRIQLRMVGYREGDWWIAHCLELDIVGQGKTPDEAALQCAELCSAQIISALDDDDLQSVFRPAPPETWALYAKASDAGKSPPSGLPGIQSWEVREMACA